MAFNGTEGGAISLAEGAALTKEHRLRNPTALKARFFGKDVINQILDQEGCMGIRVYFGQDGDGNRQLVLAGADSDENDLLDLVADTSIPCPNYCSSSNALNT
jgi:hypothetical protein